MQIHSFKIGLSIYTKLKHNIGLVIYATLVILFLLINYSRLSQGGTVNLIPKSIISIIQYLLFIIILICEPKCIGLTSKLLIVAIISLITHKTRKFMKIMKMFLQLVFWISIYIVCVIFCIALINRYISVNLIILFLILLLFRFILSFAFDNIKTQIAILKRLIKSVMIMCIVF